MKNFEFKRGDLIKLRDDLEDGKYYDGTYYSANMYFKGFKKIDGIDTNDNLIIYDDTSGECFCYTKEMLEEVIRPAYETIYKRKEPILDDKEREYLANVIKPFRDKVKCIVKYKNYYNRSEYIAISLKNDTPIHLPYFNEDTMYKNMELNTEYILKELGLWIRFF